MVLKVIIDTNFLLIPGDFGVDIFQEITEQANNVVEFIILQKVIQELEDLCVNKDLNDKQRKSAKLGLALLKQKNLKIEHCSNEHTDDAIVKKSLEFKEKGDSVAIATQDKQLTSRCLNYGVQVFTLRQKKKVLLLK